MKSDIDIQRDAEAAVRLCPGIDPTDLAVKVTGGVTTLTGYARNFFEKDRAQEAVKSVTGVAAVADDVQVRLPATDGLTDPEIARNAIAALKQELPERCAAIRILVHRREVRLEGTVESNSERKRAEHALGRILGVTEVHNFIGVAGSAEPAQIAEEIEQVFHRSAVVDAHQVCVQTHGSEVTLTGAVRTCAERDEAQATARSAPGVFNVKNEIVVKPRASGQLVSKTARVHSHHPGAIPCY